MRAIVSAPTEAGIDREALEAASARITEWLNDPENVAHPKPLVLLDGWSVEIFDDDWNFVTRSPYWEPPTMTTELLEAKVSHDWPVIGLLLLSIALGCVSVLLWAYWP